MSPPIFSVYLISGEIDEKNIRDRDDLIICGRYQIYISNVFLNNKKEIFCFYVKILEQFLMLTNSYEKNPKKQKSVISVKVV